MESAIKHHLRAGEQLVYPHIPKTAGTTFSAVLDRLFPGAQTRALYEVDFGALAPGELDGARCVRGHFPYGLIAQLLTRPASYITLLRDPIELALSHYGHIQRRPPVPRYALGHGMDLEEFLWHPLAFHRVANVQSRWLGAPLHLDPALDHHQAVAEALIFEEAEAVAGKYPAAARAMRVLDAMPFFGLVERFDDALALFTYTFGFAPIRAVERKNSARIPRPQRAQVAPRLLDRLVALNQEDLALYAYAQRLFAMRYHRMLADLVEGASQHPSAEVADHAEASVSVSVSTTPAVQ